LAPDLEGGALKVLASKRKQLAAGVLVASILVLVHPGAEKLRSRLVRSLTIALGRQVDVGSVTVRLLPLPSFDLQNVTVHEDPSFSAEPMVRSQDVTAILRISSLLRGRLEISRLSFSEPSLNLVRNNQGHWNLEDLLQRAARSPVAPTAKRQLETRPAFPYIDVKGARINVKVGQEKKPYALSDAEFSLWQDSENTWGVRLRAQPFRSDSNLSDTGIVRIEGSWQRAQSLRTTPLQFRIEWDEAQLGQATKFFWGDDKGWRGAISISAILAGTPENLLLDVQSSISDFHRYDIAASALALRAHCSGRYSSADQTISQLSCRAPVRDGLISLNGTIGARFASTAYDLRISAENLPLQSLIEFARHGKKNIPDDLFAIGKLDASFTLEHALGVPPVWQGEGETTSVRLQSKLANADLTLENIPFKISSGRQSEAIKPRRPTDSFLALTQPHMEIGPLVLATGASIPAAIRGEISRAGYDFTVQGESEIQQLLQSARIAGLPISHPALTGPARVDLRIRGPWAGFAPPVVTGKLQLHSAQATVRGLKSPVEITSASLLLTPEDAQVQDVAATIAHSTWRGSLTLPRRCEQPGTCPVRFDLRTNEISLAEVNRLLNPRLLKHPWYGFFSSSSGGSYLGTLYAEGKLGAGHLSFHHFTADRVSADLELQRGKLRLSNLRGEVLGGKHSGEWKADFTKRPPVYSASGTLNGVALEQLAEPMHDGWITGTAAATYEGTASGWTADDLFNSGTGSLEAEVFDGVLPHLTLAGETDPTRVSHFAGRLLLEDGQFHIRQAQLQTSDNTYQVSGTASLKRVLDLRLMRDAASGFKVTGTLDQPHVAVTTTPETQAALKP
jgi:AsmA family/AsmA-like C-terminal region